MVKFKYNKPHPAFGALPLKRGRVDAIASEKGSILNEKKQLLVL